MTAEDQALEDDGHLAELLARWRQGDRDALNEILKCMLPWLRRQARRLMGDLLRLKAETFDYVEETVLEFLRYQPSLPVLTPSHLRSLMLRILQNTLRDRHHYYRARRRTPSRERPLPSEGDFDAVTPLATLNTPSHDCSQQEEYGLICLALELLPGPDRDIITLRMFAEMPYARIGRVLEIDEHTARMRFSRAFSRLTTRARHLQEGRVEEALRDVADRAGGSEDCEPE